MGIAVSCARIPEIFVEGWDPIDWHEGLDVGPKRVLVVDDDDDTVHAILDALLDAEGNESLATFKIEHSNNAFDAGLKMRDLKPDIIF